MSLIDLHDDLLICIAGHLSPDDLPIFALTCRRFATIARLDSVWREMLLNRYGVTYKLPEESWKSMYTRKTEDPSNNRICPHLCLVTAQDMLPYAERYHQILGWLSKNLNCRTCGQNQAESGLCFYIWQGNTRPRCRDCAYKYHAMAPRQYGILLRINVLQMYCFICSRLLGESRGDKSEAYYVQRLLEHLASGSELGRIALSRKQQCLRERELFAKEADRPSIRSETFYLIDHMWLWSWFLRLCDGKTGHGPILNDALSIDGRLRRDIRPRSTAQGGFSIVTPHLWHYLVETYGLSGNAFSSDDLQGAAYDEVRQAISKWKLV